jgi:hypothetical protein
MKFLLKQLQLFFPFVFPMYILGDGARMMYEEYLVQKVNKELVLPLQKQVEELTARVKKLEEEKADKKEVFRFSFKEE